MTIAIYTAVALVGIALNGWGGWRRHTARLRDDAARLRFARRSASVSRLRHAAARRAERRGHDLRRHRSRCFLRTADDAPRAAHARILALAGAWLGPLPLLARQAFFAHMAMHMIVVAIAAPFLALGIAGSSLDPVRKWPALFPPIPHLAAELMVVWACHAPALHHAARHAFAGLVAEQGSFLVSGLLIWLAAFGGASVYRRERAGAGVAALLLTSMHMTLLGALLALTPRPLYAHAAHFAEPLAARRSAPRRRDHAHRWRRIISRGRPMADCKSGSQSDAGATAGDMIARLFRMLLLFLGATLGVVFVAGSVFGAGSRRLTAAFVSGWRSGGAMSLDVKDAARRGVRRGILLTLLATLWAVGSWELSSSSLGLFLSRPARLIGRSPSGF